MSAAKIAPVIPIKPPPHPAFQTATKIGFEPADNNRRVVAYIIDLLISGAAGKIFVSISVSFLHVPESAAAIINFFLLAYFYWVGLTQQFGATPGKKVMGLKIVTEDFKVRPSFEQLILREVVGRMVSTVPLFLGFAWVSFNKERKSWHDMIAKTRVINYR